MFQSLEVVDHQVVEVIDDKLILQYAINQILINLVVDISVTMFLSLQVVITYSSITIP